MKTSELTGPALDWAVAKCNGWEPGKYMMAPDIRKDVNGEVIGIMVPSNREYIWFKPSTDWSQGGPITEREKIDIRYVEPVNEWHADTDSECESGPTPLIAAMRCYVASKLGDEVEVPGELNQ